MGVEQVAKAKAKADAARAMLNRGAKASPSGEQEQEGNEHQQETEGVGNDDQGGINTAGIERPPHVELDDWESRFKLLRASRDKRLSEAEAEITRLKSELRERDQRIAQLAPPAQAESGFRITDEEKELLGEADSRVLEKLAGHVEKRFDDIETRQKVSEVERRQKLFEDLDSLEPTWRDVNVSAEFAQWLDAPNDLGVNLRDALNHAVDKGDTSSIIVLFRKFAARSNPSTQRAGLDASTQVPTGSRDIGSDGMIEMWSVDEIADHYAEKNKLIRTKRYFGADKERIEARQIKIDRARAEGRIG